MRGKDCSFSLLALPLCFLVLCTVAQAGTVSFNFNSITPGSTNPSSVLTSQLGGGLSVSVSGAVATNSWNADGHVFSSANTLSGQNVGINGSNGFSNTFLMNNEPSSQAITMNFTGLTVTGVSFTFEIFPDISCPAQNNCGAYNSGTGLYANQPDFNFVAGNVNQTWNAAFPAQSGAGCQASHALACETAAQMGPTAVSYTSAQLGAGVNSLVFNDWPAEIGIQNLVVTYNTPPSPTPEPASLVLLGTGLLGAARMGRRRSPKAL